MWERGAVHFYRNAQPAMPTSEDKEVGALLKAIHAQENHVAAKQKTPAIATLLQARRTAKDFYKI